MAELKSANSEHPSFLKHFILAYPPRRFRLDAGHGELDVCGSATCYLRQPKTPKWCLWRRLFTSSASTPARATRSQQVFPANSIASVSSPKTLSKEKLASIAKVIGGLLFSVLAILVIGLVLIGGARLAVWVQPWVEGLAALTLGIVIPVCLLLLISRKTCGYGGIGIYFAARAQEENLFWL